MGITEESMRFLEEQIPELAEAAVRQAYWDTLNSGSSVKDLRLQGYLDFTRPLSAAQTNSWSSTSSGMPQATAMMTTAPQSRSRIQRTSRPRRPSSPNSS